MTTLAYEEAGSGIPVVFIHGFPFNRSLWLDQEAVLKRSCRVVLPDLPGHGESQLTGGPATMEAMAASVIALMDTLAIERAVICGLSMGGYVALALCRAFSERIAALVLADTRATADTEEAKRNREQLALKATAEGMQPIIDAMLPKLMAPATFKNHPDQVDRVREMMATTNPEGAAAALRGMAARADQTESLSKIKVPTLIVVGEHDQITPPPDAAAMHARISGSRMEVIKGAGHVSNIEAAETFNQLLIEFLRQLTK